MFIQSTVDVLIGAGLGVVAGAFVPALGRKIKALYVKIALKVVAKAKAEEASVAAKLEAEAKKV
jgi:predicted small secreted protein